MAEKPTPPILKHIEKGDSPPGHLAYHTLHMAGVNSLPIQTGTLRAIAADCFGVDVTEYNESRQQPVLVEGCQVPFPQPALSSHDARYKMALELGHRLFGPPNDAKLFARSILAPQFIVEKEFGKSFWLENVAKLALKADMPVEIAIDKLRDIIGNKLPHTVVIAGFRQNPRTDDDKGFIWTARGTRYDATRVSKNADRLFEREESVFLARTEYNGNLGIYKFVSGNKHDFERPDGEKETLIQFNFGKKTGEISGKSEYTQWVLSQNSPKQLVIPLDPLEGFS